MAQVRSVSEPEALAREIAADQFVAEEDVIEVTCGECEDRFEVDGLPFSVVRDAVEHGWNAAMDYIEKERQREPKPRDSSVTDGS